MRQESRYRLMLLHLTHLTPVIRMMSAAPWD